MKSCIKLGGDLVYRTLALDRIGLLIKDGDWDFIVGAGSEFSSRLDHLGIKHHFERDEYNVEKRLIDVLEWEQYVFRQLFLPIQGQKMQFLEGYFNHPKNVIFIGPIRIVDKKWVNENSDVYIHMNHQNYNECYVFAKPNSRKEHFSPILAPKGNVELITISKDF